MSEECKYCGCICASEGNLKDHLSAFHPETIKGFVTKGDTYFAAFDPKKHVIAKDALIAISDNEAVPFAELLKSHLLRRNILAMAKSKAYTDDGNADGYIEGRELDLYAIKLSDLEEIINELIGDKK